MDPAQYAGAVGTVPIYQALEKVNGDPVERLEQRQGTLAEQAEQGVDYFTIHAGVRLAYIHLTANRVTGIVRAAAPSWPSGACRTTRRASSTSASTRSATSCANTTCRSRSATACAPADPRRQRPRAIRRAGDLGELTKIAWAKRLQVMIEGPGHVPMHKIAVNVDRQLAACHEAPSIRSGPLMTDIAPGYDHITSAIGAAMIGWFGTAMLCYVTPKEHLGLPNREGRERRRDRLQDRRPRRRPGQGPPGAHARQRPVPRALRVSLGRSIQLFARSRHRARFHDETLPKAAKVAHFCSMCGPQFCSMKITQDVRDYAATLNDKEQGMADMSKKFLDFGAEVYVDADKVKESNKVL